MELILLERVPGLGQMGKVVNVKDGYGRNYLLPQGKALRATKANLAKFEQQKAELEARNLKQKAEAEEVAAAMNGQSFIVIRQAAESGALFGSVTARDVAELAVAAGFKIERSQVVLVKPVKELGVHSVNIILHPEVTAHVTVNVARSVEEAQLQAEGKSIAQMRAEEEAKADFDVATLFAENAAANAAERGDIDG